MMQAKTGTAWRVPVTSSSSVLQQRLGSAGARGNVHRPQAVSTLVREVVKEVVTISDPPFAAPTPAFAQAPAPAAPLVQQVIDPKSLSKRLEAKVKAFIALEEQERASWPTVRVRVHRPVPLGEAWKITGPVPELGRMKPAVAPFMKWTEGDWWTYEGKVRPGTTTFKLVLRRPDGAYFWDEGPDHILEVPSTAGPDDVLDVTVVSAPAEA